VVGGRGSEEGLELRFKTLRNGTGLDDIPIWVYVVKVQFFQTDAESFGLLLQN
jgi:hypothetical protein